MVYQPTTVAAEPERLWCLCLHSKLLALAVGAVYTAVNVAAVLAGGVYAGVAQPATGPLTATLGGCLVCSLNATASLLLVVGVRRARWRLMLAWLTWYAVFQGLLTLAWLGGVVHLVQDVAPRVSPSATADFSWRVLVPVLPVGIIVLAAAWYAYAAVLAHFMHLRQQRVAPGKLGDYRTIRET